MITLVWVLSLLLNHQRELEKAKDELDMYIGNDRNVEESDITKSDVKGQNYELVPFGSGRRACPACGGALGLGKIVALPSNQVVDMTESMGLTNLKATPLELLLTPRLDTKLYED